MKIIIIIIVIAILGFILYSSFIKYSGKVCENERVEKLKRNIIDINIERVLEDTQSQDLNKVISVEKYLDFLLKSNKDLGYKIKRLKAMELLNIPNNINRTSYYGTFNIDNSVPIFFLNEVKKLIAEKDIKKVYIAQKVLSKIATFYQKDMQNACKPINDAIELCIDNTAEYESTLCESEIISYESEALNYLGLPISFSVSKEVEKERIKKSNEIDNKMKCLIQKEETNRKWREAFEEEKSRLKNEYKIKSKELIDKQKELEDEKNNYFNMKEELIATIEKAQLNVEKYKKQVEDCISMIKSGSSGKIIPYFAGIIADIETIEIKEAADALDWGKNQVRLNKVISLNELRNQTKCQLEGARIGYYQLKYLLELFPSLQDFLDEDYDEKRMDLLSFSPSDEDPIRHYLSKEEWNNLTTTEKNQLALDRYIDSHSKNNWQIGRDYELYIGQLYMKKGYKVDFTGSYMGLEDMGRDLICLKDDEILIIQCKYWSKDKVIHEKHINQLYGTVVSYSIEHDIPLDKIKGYFITNTTLSDVAFAFANRLGIEVMQNEKINAFPRIKCNIGIDENGNETKIYHLPMDISYDSAKITKQGEFFAYTVVEAESAGFRRSYKWHGNETQQSD